MARVFYALFGIASCAVAAGLFVSGSSIFAIAAAMVGVSSVIWAVFGSSRAVARQAQEDLSNYVE
jgi:hypothetical protein